jgi:hypothetical protein
LKGLSGRCATATTTCRFYKRKLDGAGVNPDKIAFFRTSAYPHIPRRRTSAITTLRPFRPAPQKGVVRVHRLVGHDGEAHHRRLYQKGSRHLVGHWWPAWPAP